MLTSYCQFGTAVANTIHQKKYIFGRRKQMKNFMAVLGCILLSMVVTANLLAADGPRGRGRTWREEAKCHEKGGEYALFAKLNLTNEQKARIKELRDAHLRDIKPLRDQIFIKSGDLRLLWLQVNPDKEKILAVQKEIRSFRDQMQDKNTALRVDILNVLTPEQQEKAKTLRLGCGFGAGMEDGSMMGPGPGMRGHGAGMMGR
jgi:Spy/CpxP family protein refolding chaperone